MYYAAISTDIRKSSSNWNLLPEWMQLAVMYTNNLTEYVFQIYQPDGLKGMILPNSPEGDAYTLYYSHHDKNKLIDHVYFIASLIKVALMKTRAEGLTRIEETTLIAFIEEEIKEEYENNGQEINKKIQDYFHMKENLIDYPYMGNIILRVGVAVSDDKPIEYYYNGKKSYRGGVIRKSETAEEQAPTEPDLFGRYYYDDNKVHMKDLSILPGDENYKYWIDSKWSEWVAAITKETVKVEKNQSGVVIFVQYKYGITDEMMKNYPHMYTLRAREFRNLHDETNKTIGQENLIKVKRDSSSMYYVPNPSGSFRQKDYVTLFNRCCVLLSVLPKGCSIGLCYSEGKDGKLNVVKDLTSSKVKDIFGPTVNMAARMEMVDYAYPTSEGMTLPSDHHNRIAFAVWDVKYAERMTRGRKGAKMGSTKTLTISLPYRVDKIPLELLNAGYGESVYVVSKKLHGLSAFKIGDKVTYKASNGRMIVGTVINIDPLEARIQTENTEIVHQVRVRLLQKMDGEAMDKGLQDFLKSASIKVDIKL